MELEGKYIVIVGPAHPYRGGLGTFNERFARELALKNKVEICTFTLQYPGFLFPGQTQFSDELAPQDLTIHRELNSVNPINWVLAGLKYQKKRPDLVIFRYWMPFFGPLFGTFARLVKRNGHTKVVAITDNIIPHERRFFDQPFTHWFLKPLDGAVTMSREVLKQLDDLGFDRPHEFNPHPLYDNFGEGMEKEEARKKLGLNPLGRYLLFFGFIRKYKGLDLLLQAMAHPEIRQRNIHLVVAGEFYEDRKPYDDLIANEGIAENVLLHTQFIPNSEVATYFSAADLVVQPYRSATQSGVSQVAYQFGKPMVVTQVGGLAEWVPDGKVGYVVQPTPKDIAEAILRFYDEGEVNRFSEGLAEMKKVFSWQKLVEAIGRVAGL